MGKKRIGIIGLGVCGLHLAYALLKDSRFIIELFAHKDAGEVLSGRIPSTQVHFESLLQRETSFDIPDYGTMNHIKKIELKINDQKMFKGKLEGRAVSIDQRLYLSRLIDGLVERNVNFHHKRLDRNELINLTSEFDLIIDCTGKIGPVSPFGLSNDLDLPKSPLRLCTAGFFNGIVEDEKNKLSFNIIPGQGEIFEMSNMTKRGPVRSLLIEAVPGGSLDMIRETRNPAQFAEEIKNLLKTFLPSVHARIDEKKFKLADENAFTKMAIRPVVRIPFTLVNDTLILGCGDSVALNDPITGQGANTASFCAEKLYQTIVENIDSPWDEKLGEQYWSSIKEYVIKVSEWTNAMMGPLSRSFQDVLGKAAQDQDSADDFVNMFHDPINAHKTFFEAPIIH